MRIAELDPLGQLLRHTGSFRGRSRIHRLWRNTTGRGIRDVSLPEGATIRCDLSIPYEAEVWLGREEQAELETLRATLSGLEGTFIDVGANIGLWTLTAAPVAESVVAIEASPTTAAKLRANIALSDLDNVTLVEAAAGGTEGTVFVEERQEHNTNRIADSGVPVRLTTVDACAPARVAAVKIDAEGYEEQVLEGARRVLAHRPPVFIEFNTEAAATDRIEEWGPHRLLTAAGYGWPALAASRRPAPPSWPRGWYVNLLYRDARPE